MVKPKGNKQTPTSSDTGNIILNACLSIIHFHMMKKTKQFIQEEVLAAFDFQDLKKARELLFNTLENNPKGYNGPTLSSDREKAIHCFDVIFNKMKEIDGVDSQSVSFACPSLELDLIPRKSLDGHSQCTQEIGKLYSEMNELKGKVSYITGLVTANANNKLSINPSSYSDAAKQGESNSPASAIPGSQRERLISTSKRRRLSIEAEDYVSCEEDISADDESPFIYPREQRRKMAQRANKVSNSAQVTGNTDAMPSSQPRKLVRKNTVTGTGKPLAGSRFKGVTPSVPKVFVSKCDLLTEPEDIKDHLIAEGISSVSSVELAIPSRPQLRPPRSKSFIVTLGKVEDFQKVMSGAHLPDNVEIKKFYSRPPPSDKYGSFSKQIESAISQLEVEAMPLRPNPVNLELTTSQRKQQDTRDVENSDMMDHSEATASSQDQSSNNIQGDDTRIKQD